VLRPAGLLLAIPSAADLPDPATLDQHKVRGLNLLVEPDHHALEQLARLADDGLLTVHVDATADLADISNLHTAGETGRTLGKLVATV
jgi:NADPH:quinone reductase-like Zn-dependent oxidoreductase